MEAADIRLSRELEGEKRLLKQMYAELSLENWILKEMLEKDFRTGSQKAVGLPAT